MVGWGEKLTLKDIDMIGYLRGKVLEKVRGEVWVEVNGVGYRVRVGTGVYEGLNLGEEAELYIYTAVREDAIDLYGFFEMGELKMFELMLTVSGVGPKTALAIVGGNSVSKIERAVREADVGFFQAVPGIGKKGAQRIIVDLKGKLPSMKELDLSEEGEGEDEVMVALMQFGFSRNEVRVAVKGLDASLSEEEKIREGLRRLGRGRQRNF